MKTTRTEPDAATRSNAEMDREVAWSRLRERRVGTAAGMPSIPRDGKWLADIATRYDRITKRAREGAGPVVSETEVLAALRVTRTLRSKLDEDELALINLARQKRITWARIAEALEMRNRQSAERRRLQLSRAARRHDGSQPRTQSERVEAAREERGRRAEREWALACVQRIRAFAAGLVTIPDLQQRADRSPEGLMMSAPITYPNKPHQMTWPQALKQALEEHDRFRAAPWECVAVEQDDDTMIAPGNDPMEDWRIRQKEAQIAHRMLGLLGHAADPRYVDLSDHPELLKAVRRLCQDFREQCRRG
ncbi:hypothetical protein ACPB9J_31735 [Streptomyces lavendulocolor]|uniref:hypothetical protein n=1 Tax=Streptomyces lavendulocolor TaxID=67316 RepID=UPI003C2D67F1